MHSCVRSKNVKWCHLIWPTLYVTEMADRLDPMESICRCTAKDCGMSCTNAITVRVLVSQPITAYVGHLCWQLPVAITCGG